MAKFKIIKLGSSEVLALKTNILSILLPAYFLFYIAFLRIKIWLHSSGEKALISLKVAYIDLILEQLFPPLGLEVEPLQVPCRIAVHSHKAVILPLANFDHAVQVSSFEE